MFSVPTWHKIKRIIRDWKILKSFSKALVYENFSAMKIGKKIGGKPQDVIMVWWSSPKLEETNKGKKFIIKDGEDWKGLRIVHLIKYRRRFSSHRNQDVAAKQLSKLPLGVLEWVCKHSGAWFVCWVFSFKFRFMLTKNNQLLLCEPLPCVLRFKNLSVMDILLSVYAGF